MNKPLRNTSPMATKRTWEIMAEIFPTGTKDEAADFLDVSADTVRRWTREPESGDTTATGRRNPVDNFFRVMDAAHQIGADGALDYLVDCVRARAAQIKGQRHRQISDEDILLLAEEMRRAVNAYIEARREGVTLDFKRTA